MNSFFVFGTNGDICHGTSSIKFYDLKNKYVGKYNVGMPDHLPNSLKNNKLVYLKNDKCPRKNKHSINLSNGLPKTFFVECTNGLGDEYIFE